MRNKTRLKWVVAVLVGIVLVPSILIAVLKYQIRNEDPENVEFYITVLGSNVRPVKQLAGCTTAPWYGALDSADFYAMALPDEAFRDPPQSYPNKMEYQTDHKMVQWHRGPASNIDQPVLLEGIEWAVSWLKQDDYCTGKSRYILTSITTILNRNDIHLAYAYRNDIGYVNRLALYILDPSNKVFYLLRFGI